MSGVELVLAFLAGVVMGGARDRWLRADDREQGRLVVADRPLLRASPSRLAPTRPTSHRAGSLTIRLRSF
jgi:hypothetical protein